jgi:hypothetical protein
MKIKTQRIVRSLGKDWGMAVQRQVLKAAADQARFRLRSGKRVGKDKVEVVIPLTVHMVFPRKGETFAAPDGGVDCFCYSHQTPSGGYTCVCIGPGAAGCDCAPPPVA